MIFTHVPATMDFNYEVVDIKTRSMRVARYGNRIEESMTLKSGDKMITIHLTNYHESFAGRVKTFSVGQKFSLGRELKNGSTVDRNNLK